jgi:murein DD-endopeptidase MepM/ murein hydrolase activator NlpD
VSTTSSTSTTTVPATTVPATTVLATTTTLPEPRYAFPFVDHAVSWGRTHHDYPAIDVFGCGATVVSPTNGTVVQVRDFDPWDPSVNAGSTRGGKYVAILGVDGVRYYFAHLDGLVVHEGQAVQPGDPLGPMGQTGDARNSVCHTHFGISWPCPQNEWKVRRGKVWPMDYLAAWRHGEQRSPATAVEWTHAAEPDACADAIAQADAVYS